MTTVFVVVAMLLALALGFVLGRVWEIRERLRDGCHKTISQGSGAQKTISSGRKEYTDPAWLDAGGLNRLAFR